MSLAHDLGGIVSNGNKFWKNQVTHVIPGQVKSIGTGLVKVETPVVNYVLGTHIKGYTAPKKTPKPSKPKIGPMQGPGLGGRDAGLKIGKPSSNRGSRGNRGKTVIHTTPRPNGGTGSSTRGSSGGSSSNTTAAKTTATTAAASTSDPIATSVDQIIKDSIAANTRATTAYQTQNAGLRSSLTDAAAKLGGMITQPTGAVAGTDSSLGGSGNADSAARVALINNVGTAQTNALRDYLTAHAHSGTQLLGSMADAENARALEFSRQQQASRPQLIQKAQDDALNQLYTQAKTQAIGNQFLTDQQKIKLQQQAQDNDALYKQGQLDLGAAKIKQSGANSIAKAGQSAARYGIQLQMKQATAVDKIFKQLYPTRGGGSTTVTNSDGSKTTTPNAQQQGRPGQPLREGIEALRRQGLRPIDAIQIAAKWAIQNGGGGSFKPGHEAGTYKVFLDAGLTPNAAAQQVSKYYGIHWTPTPVGQFNAGWNVGAGR